MVNVFFLSVIVRTLLSITYVEALECFGCSNISDAAACNTTVTCTSGQACYQESIVSGPSNIVTLGCVNNKQCGVAASGPGTLIGRDVTKRQDNKCHECCATDRCNNILCARRNPASCIDDKTMDCPRMNSVFGICKDINHAKSLCPNFCGLCNVVDGVWTEWTSWSTCDVTCEDGTQSRSRTCTNPAPANGGLECVGKSVETKHCHKSLCPVHGKWSSWEDWGACSVSCDFGIQRRQRTCTNPAPLRFGDHCFGLNLDDRLCIPKACSNGGWTRWGNWGICSVTCGGGVRSRSRTCTDPRPSLIGRYCDGDSSEVGSCNVDACRVDGMWTEWMSWSTCDVTCENGTKSRSRTCTNPAPAHDGQDCIGNNMETKQCIKSLCPVTNVAFRCNGTTQIHQSPGMTIRFKTISLNQGNGYNKTTGIFTAPETGTYMLSTQLCVNQGHDIVYAIVVDNKNIKVGHFNDADWTFCHSAVTVAVLSRGSQALVKCISCDTYSLVERENYSNTFSGVLVHV